MIIRTYYGLSRSTVNSMERAIKKAVMDTHKRLPPPLPPPPTVKFVQKRQSNNQIILILTIDDSASAGELRVSVDSRSLKKIKNRKTGLPWLDVATNELGISEIAGSRHNPRILEYHATTSGHKEDEVPWCSSFVNFCLKQVNISGTNSARAKSWLSWSGGNKTTNPKRGCIVVFDRPSAGSNSGHVAFFMGQRGNKVTILGGNQSDEVSISNRSKDLVNTFISIK